jgi:hypothetical protein
MMDSSAVGAGAQGSGLLNAEAVGALMFFVAAFAPDWVFEL